MNGFYRIYGKHVFLIETVLIAVMTSFSLPAFLSAVYVAHTTSLLSTLAGPVLLASMIVLFAHVLVFGRIASLELYPCPTLRLEHINLSLYRALILFSLATFASVVLADILFSRLGLGDQLALIVQILVICFLSTVLMLLVLFPLSISTLASRNKARLSFRAVLVGLKLLSEEQIEERRSKLVRSHIKWLRDGLRSYNRFLYKFKPVHIEITNIDDYYRSVCCASLIGNQAERDIVVQEIRRLLDSVGGSFREEDFRQLLIGLRNIKNMQRNNELELSELDDLVRVLTFSDRLKERVKSPYFEAVVAAVEIAVAVLVYVL